MFTTKTVEIYQTAHWSGEKTFTAYAYGGSLGQNMAFWTDDNWYRSAQTKQVVIAWLPDWSRNA